MLNKIPPHLKFLGAVFVSALVFFSIFRCVLLFNNLSQINSEAERYVWFALFNRGLLFDTAVTCYILAFPLLALTVGYLFNFQGKTFRVLSISWLLILFFVAFAIASVDIPYFNYYNSRVTKAVLSWTDDMGLMAKAVLTDYHYLTFLSLFLVFLGLYSWLLMYIYRNTIKLENSNSDPLLKRVTIVLFSFFLLFLGIRGDYDLKAKPLQIEHSFETSFPVINQLGLNSSFNLVHSWGDFEIDFFDDSTAISNTKKYLNISGHNSKHPVARKVKVEGKPKLSNIVIILMESMSHEKIGKKKNNYSLTPNLDNLAQNSLYYPNTWAAGKHTYNGIFSTLFALPALMNNKPTVSTSTASLSYAGFSNVLKKSGYHNLYFCTNESSFDNIKGFLPHNEFDKIYDINYYKKNDIIGGWGVPDHVMFDYSIGIMDSISENNKPFLSVLVTVSTHSPYDIPEVKGFKPVSSTRLDRSYEYADFSIGRFLRAASSSKWFNNTIFVLIGDHGQNFDPTYEMSLAYHHTPLFILGNGIDKPKQDNKLALQIDVFPTVMGLLNIPYTNNTLGIDLLRESRPFAYFSDDQHIGCLNNQYYYILKNDNTEALYEYQKKSSLNCIRSHAQLADSMKNYTFSMLQTMQYMINNKSTGL